MKIEKEKLINYLKKSLGPKILKSVKSQEMLAKESIIEYLMRKKNIY